MMSLVLIKQNWTERKSPSPFWLSESAKAGNARFLFHHIFNDKLIVSSRIIVLRVMTGLIMVVLASQG